MLTACSTSYQIPSKKYDDKMISTSKKSDGTTMYKFHRHGLIYVDTAKKHRLLDRKVYDGDQLVYRYPVLAKNVKPGIILLKSGNDFLDQSKGDTIVYIGNDLPVMNRYFWGKGVMLARLTETSYLIKPSPNNTGVAKLYISTTHNYEEIKDDKGFIADSLVLIIK